MIAAFVDGPPAAFKMCDGPVYLLTAAEEVVLRWKATKAGCFTYHCAPGGAMIPYHVCHGMNGAVMVLPRDGLKDCDSNLLRYDSIAYIGEQDYYLPRDQSGAFKKYKAAGEAPRAFKG